MDYINARYLLGRVRSLKFNSEHFEAAATIILRVPGYFILNGWLEFDIFNSIPRSLAWADIVSAGFAVFVLIQGLLLLLLPLRLLVSLYMHYLSVATLAAADLFSRYYVNRESVLTEQFPGYGTVSFQGFSNMVVPHKPLFDLNNIIQSSFLRQQIAGIVFHTLAAVIVTFFLDLNNNREKILLLVYLIPIFARLAGLPVHYLPMVHNCVSCFVFFLTVMYIFLCLPRVFRFMKSLYFTLTIQHELYGTIGLAINTLYKMFVPIQLFLYWIMLFVSQFYVLFLLPQEAITNNRTIELSNQLYDENAAFAHPWYYILISIAAEICYTPLMLLSTCAAVVFFSRGVLNLAYWFTAGRSVVPHLHDFTQTGLAEGATMLMLSTQLSLCTREHEERAALLSVILMIVMSSLIQSMYELVEPHIMALSAQGIAPLSHHLRAISMCLMLLIMPLYMVHMFTTIFERDFWLLLLVSSSVMTAVQVLGLMVTYALLTYDALCTKNWPGLDDVVYYTRATTRVFEFIVAVFVVGAGIMETLNGLWTPMNVVVLIVHCYFNVFQRLQQGWKSFLLRLEAAKKISGLPVATDQQLVQYNDVCSICFFEMTSACVTTCNHLFHPPCLRKWLYVQDKCPLCQTSITIPNTEEELSNSREEVFHEVSEETLRETEIQTRELEREMSANLPVLDDSDDEDLSYFDMESRCMTPTSNPELGVEAM